MTNTSNEAPDDATAAGTNAMTAEELQLVTDTARRILEDRCTTEVVEAAQAGQFPEELWATLQESGLVGMSPEEDDWSAPLAVVAEAAGFAAPLPLAEALIATLLLRRCGANAPAGVVTAARGELAVSDGRVRGQAGDVPFVDWADALVLVSGTTVVQLAKDEFELQPARNLAGEPRSRVSFDVVPRAPVMSDPEADEWFLHLGAMTRSLMMSRAMETCLTMSVQYAMERHQFGRPIARFQAIQHQLAVVAGEVAAGLKAADDARLLPVDARARTRVAVAKARSGEAAGVVAEIAHQVHGAMGFTMEHPLNLHTRRLWVWRDDFGNESFWQRRLGESATAAGAEGLWDFITSA